MTLKDLAVSFHFPKFSTSRDFYKAFGCPSVHVASATR